MPHKPSDGANSDGPNQRWEAIPLEFRKKIIQNVWCTHCRGVVEIVDYRAYSAQPDIVLRGRCSVCHGEVARVVEPE